MNRLRSELSPYLQQHAENPVGWYPWGEEALARARELDRPIFLSVGYSTCHWCHVMERESFESDAIARLLDEHFVPIKVDREERPDLDDVYMLATQLVTGQGGWPNSVWLTPDGRPWYAGTYFPPEDRHGRIGFPNLLSQLAEAWSTRRDEIEQSADQLADRIRQLHESADTGGATEIVDPRSRIAAALETLSGQFDRRFGGFGGAPKFPPHSTLQLFLYEIEAGRDDDGELRAMLTHTLGAMASGGIHDQIGGGFHRYSTDRQWLLPHFEKMLYDNAQLAIVYARTAQVTGDERYGEVARGICDWVLAEMLDERGGFYSAIDADSEGEEGLFYVWKIDEIREALESDDDAAYVAKQFGCSEAGNFLEEATGVRTGKNVLHLPHGPADATERQRLAELSTKLHRVREQRVRPHLDDKVLTAWNGLMIGAFAEVGASLGEPEYIAAATKAAQFVDEHLRQGEHETKSLLASYRNGTAHILAYLDDYAFLADGLLRLHAATGEKCHLESAKSLATTLLAEFHNEHAGGFYFTTPRHEVLLARVQDPYDKAIPSGNGVAAQVCLRLFELTAEARWREAAEQTLQRFDKVMKAAPQGTATLLLALSRWGDLDSSSGNEVRRQPFSARVAYDAASETGVPFSIELSWDKGWSLEETTPITAEIVRPGRDAVAVSGLSTEHADGQSVRVRGTARFPEDGELVVRAVACTEGRCLPPVELRFPAP